MSDAVTFISGRRRGLRGRFGLFRAVVENERGQSLRVRSPKLARMLVSRLNEEGAEASVPPSRSRGEVVRYAAVSVPARNETMVVADDRGRDAGQFGLGPIAVTDDRQLAERLVSLLNRLDTAHFKPPQKGPGFGWF